MVASTDKNGKDRARKGSRDNPIGRVVNLS